MDKATVHDFPKAIQGSGSRWVRQKHVADEAGVWAGADESEVGG